jgi:photosystem II reaction center protein PsbP
MTADAHPKPLGLPRRTVRVRSLLVGAAVALLVLAVYLAANALFGGDDSNKGELKGSSENNFTLSYPSAWRPLSSKELAKLPGNPIAVVRREDGKGFVVLRREGRAPKNLNSFSGDLTKALDKRIPDFQKRSSKTIKLSGGNAFFYSYIRKSKGTVHTVVLVPNGKQSYVLNTVSHGGSEQVARQIAHIILSFKR